MSVLSRRMLSQSRVIAKGNRIRDIGRLVAMYGVARCSRSGGATSSIIGMSIRESAGSN
jgi:hypothetical protein